MASPGNKIWNILGATLWFAMGAGLIALLLAAIQRKNNLSCKGVEIHIRNSGSGAFVDKKDVQKLIHDSGSNLIGKELKAIKIQKLEIQLKSNVWISGAELFFDNNEVLQVRVRERQPIARIFTSGGNSFYIDSGLAKMFPSEKASARVPVFTNFPSEASRWSERDSALLQDIKKISLFISGDPFWMAQIEQVDIASGNEFEMIPAIGDHTILFGGATDIEKKFRRLYVFYRDVLSKTGWNKYESINVQFKGQVIAVRRGAVENVQRSDTAKLEAILKQMMASSPQQWMGDDTLSRALPNYTATRSVAPRNTATPLKTMRDNDGTTTKSIVEKPASPSKSKTRIKMSG